MDPDSEVVVKDLVVKDLVVKDLVWKTILTPGTSRISQKPSEGSECLFKIDNLEYKIQNQLVDRADMLGFLKEQNTTILTGDIEVPVVMGEANCELDKLIERAFALMKDNECAYITVSMPEPPGHPETPKQERVVSFDATLLKHKKFKPMWEWTPEEKYEIALNYKNVGVELFKGLNGGQPRCGDAFHRFSRACKILISLEPIDDLELEPGLQENIEQLRLKLYTNMAMCQIKHNNYYHVIELCSKVLVRDDRNVIALYRRGYSYAELRDFERAVEDFTKLHTIEPRNRKIIQKLNYLKSCLRKVNDDCNEMVKRMFKI